MQHLPVLLSSCACVWILAACGQRAGIGPGPREVDPVHPIVTHDQVVTHVVPGIPSAKRRTVAVLDRLACGPIRDPLIDSATIARAGGYVALTDAGGVERARLVVEPNVVDSQPVTHRLTLYPHTRFFDIEATRGVGTFDQERYQLIVRPPCPEEAFAQNVWLVRTSTGPIGDPIPRVSGTPNGEMRFNLSRLSRFVISH
jgi:hypothetical protein